MLRGFSFVSTRYFDRNNTLTYGQPGELVREPVKTSIDSLATNQYLLSLLHKKDNELTETEKEYINLCYKETLENLDKETWEKILTSTEEISGIEKFNNAILEFTKDFDGLREKVGDYLSRSLEQIICGNFKEEVTLLGTIGQVLLGVVGVDLPCDIRDLAADFHKIGNGESVSFMQMGLDVIALIPVIGSAKYLDEAGTLLKKSDVADDIVKHVDELVDGVKGSTEVIDDVTESVIKSGKTTTYKILNTSSAEDVNKIFKDTMGYEPPYKPGTSVTEIQLTENATYVRVYDKVNSRMQGGWVMKAEDIAGLTPQEIQNKFALPNTPKYICDVNLEAGTRLRTGEVNPLFGFDGGGQQYDLIINGKNVGTFTNERIIGQ